MTLFLFISVLFPTVLINVVEASHRDNLGVNGGFGTATGGVGGRVSTVGGRNDGSGRKDRISGLLWYPINANKPTHNDEKSYHGHHTQLRGGFPSRFLQMRCGWLLSATQ